MQAEDANPPSRDPDLAVGASNSYARLRVLFDAVADLEDDQRAAWIEANVADAGEREALERLLVADGSESGYFEFTPGDHAARMAIDEPLRPDGLIGQRIGAFRLTRLLGKGGMAAVFLGERESGDFQQRVAVKLLRRGLYSEIEQRLFRRERQLLAALEHPHIARLIDGGVTAAGIPYLVLEYVDGVPLTRYAAERRLDVRARLELFLIVCRAVEAAHRALIVHRDIKPANILVAGDGTVKLLDFGIAKLIEDDGESATVGVFTPEYAAPEQLSSAPVTTATDVYALGILLHELLLGRRPQGSPARRPSSLAGAGRHTTLPNPAALPRILRGDLDTIILKCLVPEPEQRYASAGALADDIERHLAGRPVAAHPPSRWYRTRKFVQRHRGSVAITAALVLAIFAGLAAALWQANVARHEAARANRVRGFIEDMFTPINNSVIEAKQTSVHDLLANATVKLSKNNTLTPAERIDLQMLFSRLHEKMGEPKQAQALALQAAQLSALKLAADDPESLEAQVLYAYSLLQHDDPAHAEPLLRALEARVGASSALRGGPRVMLYDGLAELADDHSQHEVAVGYERRALQERIAQAGPDSASAATGYNNLAISLDLSGHNANAIEALHNAYAIDLKQEGLESFDTANARNNLATAELNAGRLQAARVDFLAVERVFDAAPNNTRNRNARYWQGRCQLAIAIGGTDLRTTCERALQVTRAVLEPDEVGWNARALRLDAESKLDLGDLAGARADALQANDKLGSAGDPVAIGIDDYLLAEIDAAQGDTAHAATGFARSLKRFGGVGPEYLRLRVQAELALVCAGIAVDACRGDIAVAARKALDGYSDRWNPRLLPANTVIARLDLDAGRTDMALERLHSVIAHAEPEVDTAQVEFLSARIWLVVAEATAGRCDQANADWRTTHVVLQARGLDRHPLLTPALAALRRVGACGAAFDP